MSAQVYDRDSARSLLEDELADAQYQRELAGPLRDLIDSVLEWLEGSALSLGPVTVQWGPILVAALVVAAALLVILLVRPRMQRGRRSEPAVSIEAGMTAADLRNRAAAHATAGRYDDAARDSFRAIVRTAEEQYVLSAQSGRTASEIAASLSAAYPQEAARLREAADLFNQSVYARRPLQQVHFHRLSELDLQLVEQSPSTPVAASVGTGL